MEIRKAVEVNKRQSCKRVRIRKCDKNVDMANSVNMTLSTGEINTEAFPFCTL